VWRLSPSDGAITPLYTTPVSTSTGIALLFDLAAAPGGSAVTVGRLPDGGRIIRVGAAPLEIQFGQSFERVSVHTSGAIVASAVEANGANSLRRYDVSGVLQWSVPIGANGCSLLP
jgi:hypothetical protein